MNRSPSAALCAAFFVAALTPLRAQIIGSGAAARGAQAGASAAAVQFHGVVSRQLEQFLAMPPAAGLNRLETLAAPETSGPAIAAERQAAATVLALLTSPEAAPALIQKLGFENVELIQKTAGALRTLAENDRDLRNQLLRLSERTGAGGLQAVLADLDRFFDESSGRSPAELVDAAGETSRALPAEWRLQRPGNAPLSPVEKTGRFNAEGTASGVFAEIGAGQGVAGYFFAGKQASKTILTAVSPYAKEASDARYGKTERYVSEERLRQMLAKESAEAASTRSGVPLFAFADTVATNKGKGQGWMGLRFQAEASGPWSTIVMHVKVSDADILRQHDALGRLGVNLVYGAYHLAGGIEGLISSLNDDLGPGAIEIDALSFEGPVFTGVDSRLIGLELLRRGLAASVLFDPKGRVVPAYEETWGKPTLIYLRPLAGAGAPVQRLKERLAREAGIAAAKVVVIEAVPLDELPARAESSGYLLVVGKRDGEELRQYARRLNTGYSAVALEGSGSPSDAVIPAADGGRKAPLATYRYRAGTVVE